jgi:O-antigen/teichoic acid export membrane protein
MRMPIDPSCAKPDEPVVETTRTVAKNFGILVGSQFVTWGLTLLLTVFLSRYLGASAIGKFYLADSLWAIVAILMTFGMDTLMVKEIARRPARTAELFGTTVGLRCLLGIVGFGVAALWVHHAGYPSETMYVIYIIGIATFINQCGEACRAILQGLERMDFVALSIIASKAFTTIVSIGLLLMGHGLLAIASVTIGSALIYLFAQVFPLMRLHKLSLRWDNHFGIGLLKASLPYFMLSIFAVAYQRVDTIIISLLVHDSAVGWYSAANKLFGTFLFIPFLFVTAVFPTLARMHTETPQFQPSLMRKSFQLLLIFGVPIGFGLVVMADSLVILLFGDGFVKSGPVLAVMGIALIFTYQNMLLSQFVISTDRQYELTVLIALMLVARILLDLVLMPWCQKTFDNGALGGALSCVITEASIFIGCLRLLPTGTFGWERARRYGLVLLAGLVMTATTWWLRHWFLGIPIVLGGITYIGLLVLLRLVPADDWHLLRDLARSALTRPHIGKPAADWQA